MDKMKHVLITLFAGMMIGVMIVLAIILGSDVDSHNVSEWILNHPKFAASGLIIFSIVFCSWRFNEMHPDWRLAERFKMIWKKLRP
jgi:hypothetical protein